MNRFIKLPHAVWSAALAAGELQVYTAIASYANRLGCCCVRHTVIANLCGISVPTVARSIQKLQRKGLLNVSTRYNRQGQVIANKYLLTSLQGGFTCVPRQIWGYKLAKSNFKVYLHLLRCRSQNCWEAIPSLSQMVSALHMSKRTIIDAINSLSSMLLLHKEQYFRKQDNRYGHNRYRLIIGLARVLFARMLALLPTSNRKAQRATLFNRVARHRNKGHMFFTYRVAYAAPKVKDFLCSRTFFLCKALYVRRALHSWWCTMSCGGLLRRCIGTILIWQERYPPKLRLPLEI